MDQRSRCSSFVQIFLPIIVIGFDVFLIEVIYSIHSFLREDVYPAILIVTILYSPYFWLNSPRHGRIHFSLYLAALSVWVFAIANEWLFNVNLSVFSLVTWTALTMCLLISCIVAVQGTFVPRMHGKSLRDIIRPSKWQERVVIINGKDRKSEFWTGVLTGFISSGTIAATVEFLRWVGK